MVQQMTPCSTSVALRAWFARYPSIKTSVLWKVTSKARHQIYRIFVPEDTQKMDLQRM